MNKKVLLMALCTALFRFACHGQISIGVKSNPLFFNGNTMNGKYGSKTFGTNEKDYVGFFGIVNLGVAVNYQVKDNIAVEMEMLYKNQGISQNKDRFEAINISYLEIPILLQWKQKTRTFLFLNIGPSLKIKTDAAYSYRDLTTNRVNVNMDKAFKSLVLVANIGGGISLRLNDKFSLTGEMRFGYDITQTAIKSNSVKLSSGDEWYFNKTNILQIGGLVGVTYKL